MSDTTSADGVPPGTLIEFARAFVRLSNMAHELVPRTEASNLAERLAGYLGVDPAEVTAVSHVLPFVERANLQLALDELLADQPEGELVGLSPEIAHYSDFSFPALVAGRFHGPTAPAHPVYDEVAVDIDATLRCVTVGLWLVHHRDTPVIVGVAPKDGHHGPGGGGGRVLVEVLAADPEVAQGLLDHLAARRRHHNVYRGKVLAFAHSEYGDFGISFMRRPTTTSDDVILPAADLASITRHVVGMTNRADQLLAAGQHLKRGLLLYGPPGTGKTHTINYLMAAMPERTVVILQGPSVGALGQAAAIVRSLTPAMLVIEDVDLIATERGHYGAEDTNPLMFQLLNEMDGLTPTDDVCFVLTTNRADILEPALVARPGRIDHSVRIGLPDRAARERLTRLYLDRTIHAVDDLDPIVDRTEGMTASFMKELVRRAAFLAIEANAAEDNTGAVIEPHHLDAALDEVLAHTVRLSSNPDDDEWRVGG